MTLGLAIFFNFQFSFSFNSLFLLIALCSCETASHFWDWLNGIFHVRHILGYHQIKSFLLECKSLFSAQVNSWLNSIRSLMFAKKKMPNYYLPPWAFVHFHKDYKQEYSPFHISCDFFLSVEEWNYKISSHEISCCHANHGENAMNEFRIFFPIKIKQFQFSTCDGVLWLIEIEMQSMQS